MGQERRQWRASDACVCVYDLERWPRGHEDRPHVRRRRALEVSIRVRRSPVETVDASCTGVSHKKTTTTVIVFMSQKRLTSWY